MNKFMISAILCAAGSSRRMKDDNKLLLKYGNQAIITHVTAQLLSADIGELIVVTGHQSEEIKDALSPYEGQITFVNNPRHTTGQTSSIQIGLKYVHEKADAMMICLSDMPHITYEDYDAAIKYFRANYDGKKDLITRPFYSETPGHPVIFSKSFHKKLAICPEEEGCRSVIKKHVYALDRFETDRSSFTSDIDTPDDYSDLLATI